MQATHSLVVVVVLHALVCSAVQPPQTLYVVSQAYMNNSEVLLAVSLSGLLAQQQPELIYLPEGSYGVAHQFWLADLVANHGVTVSALYNSTNGIESALSAYASHISGYILCDIGNQTLQTAVSLAGIKHGIAATIDMEPFLKSLGLPLIADARSLDPYTVYCDNIASFSNHTAVYQDTYKWQFMSDYAIATSSVLFSGPLNEGLGSEVLGHMLPNSAFLGWGNSEIELINNCSQASVYVNAADWAVNVPVYAAVESEPVKQHSFPTVNTTGVHTVTFVFTDGDNIQFLINGFNFGPNWFGSPSRGKVPIGWTLSPALYDLAPNILEYLYKNASLTETGSDSFIASPSGQGYMYPSVYGDMNGFAQQLNADLPRVDMNIVNVLDNWILDIIDDCVSPLLEQENVDAVFYYPWEDYSGLKGIMTFMNGKPVISGRANLWAGFNTPQTLATLLNGLSTDVTSPDAYSVIPVHAWTMTVDDVVECVSLLNATVQVVTPSQLVERVMKFVPQN